MHQRFRSSLQVDQQLHREVKLPVGQRLIREFLALVFRLGIYSLTLFATRIAAIVLFFAIDADFTVSKVAVLSSEKYVYLGLSITEAVFLLALFLLTVKFYMYHSWLQGKKMTTYQHIIMERKSKNQKSKVQPSTKTKLAKEPSSFKNFAPTLKSKGNFGISRHDSQPRSAPLFTRKEEDESRKHRDVH